MRERVGAQRSLVSTVDIVGRKSLDEQYLQKKTSSFFCGVVKGQLLRKVPIFTTASIAVLLFR